MTIDPIAQLSLYLAAFFGGIGLGILADLGKILRILLGVGVYFGLNTLLKLPFSKDFLDAATMASYAVRAARYCVIIFVTIGVYPFLFRLGDRIFKRKK